LLQGRNVKRRQGAATASIAKILQNRGFTVSAVKIDPYINVDAGTMNPIGMAKLLLLMMGQNAIKIWETMKDS
jgi:CTP synthase (UTP-ammonia lyase)